MFYKRLKRIVSVFFLLYLWGQEAGFRIPDPIQTALGVPSHSAFLNILQTLSSYRTSLNLDFSRLARFDADARI